MLLVLHQNYHHRAAAKCMIHHHNQQQQASSDDLHWEEKIKNRKAIHSLLGSSRVETGNWRLFICSGTEWSSKGEWMDETCRDGNYIIESADDD